MADKKAVESCCELCLYYSYDEESDSYECVMSLDEDEMASFLSHERRQCPFYRFGDEYTIVRKQN